MKRIKTLLAVLILVVGVFALSACNKNSIVGKWAYGSFVYTFNADNTGTYDAAGTVMKFTYETNDNKLSILYEGNTSAFETEYRIEDKTLIVVDSFGSEVKYERK